MNLDLHLRDLRDRINASTTKPRIAQSRETGTNKYEPISKEVQTGANRYK